MRKSFVKWLLCAVFAAALAYCACTATARAAVLSPYRPGDIVTVGSYPQTQVTNASLLAKLNAAAGEWKPYPYCAGDGTPGSMQKQNYAYYRDVSYNGETYRGVKNIESRPALVYESLSAAQDTAQVLWFRYEPVEWIVLDPAEGLLLSRRVLDAQPLRDAVYSKQTAVEAPGEGDDDFPELWYNEEFYADPAFTVPANAYEGASIGEWLNASFYPDAFSGDARRYVEAYAPGEGEAPSVYAALPSAEELGLLEDEINPAFAAELRAQGTAYAAAQGLMSAEQSALWITRTPAFGTDAVFAYAEELQTAITYVTFTGVRPVVRVNFGECFAGDVDGDDAVTAADARIVLRVSVGLDYLPRQSLYYADADGSGDVTAADARLVLRFSVKLEPETSLSHFFKPSYTAPEPIADGNKFFVDNITVTEGQTLSLASTLPVLGTQYHWYSSVPQTVSVSNDGVITARSEGFACVYLSAGGNRYYYFVTVLTPLQQRIWALREKYPHGYYWNDYPKSETYPDVTETPCTDHAAGVYAHCIGQCAGFAMLLSNEVFGKSAPYYKGVQVSGIKVGDYIRCLPHHSVFVIDTVQKGDVIGYDIAKDENKIAQYDSITVAECNWDRKCGIRWDRSIRLDTLSISSADSYSRYK